MDEKSTSSRSGRSWGSTGEGGSVIIISRAGRGRPAVAVALKEMGKPSFSIPVFVFKKKTLTLQQALMTVALRP